MKSRKQQLKLVCEETIKQNEADAFTFQGDHEMRDMFLSDAEDARVALQLLMDEGCARCAEQINGCDTAARDVYYEVAGHHNFSYTIFDL